MPTFDLGKDYNDVQEARPLPEGWYKMEIVPDYDGNGPEMRPNKAMAEGGPGAEGAGMNIVLSLEVKSEMPEYDGRRFMLYLPTPRDGEEIERNRMGQTKADAKMERIGKIFAAFSGSEASGSSVSFDLGQQAMVNVVQRIDQSTNQVSNEIPFEGAFRAVE